jgi:cobalamin biosynthesis Mg chelatase CobN
MAEHAPGSATARVLDEKHIMRLPAAGGVLIRSRQTVTGGETDASLETANRELRSLVARYKVRELQTFAFQQNVLDAATQRAEAAEARASGLAEALARVPGLVDAAVVETRSAFSQKMDELTEGLRCRDGQLVPPGRATSCASRTRH